MRAVCPPPRRSRGRRSARSGRCSRRSFRSAAPVACRPSGDRCIHDVLLVGVPVKIASTSASVSSTIFANAPPRRDGFVGSRPSPFAAPSWYSATRRRPGRDLGDHAVDLGHRLAELHALMPPGVTSGPSPGDRTDHTHTQAVDLEDLVPGSSGSPFGRRWPSGTGSRPHRRRDRTRSSAPLSNSWFPTPDAARSSAFRRRWSACHRSWRRRTATHRCCRRWRETACRPRRLRAQRSIVPANFTVLASMRPWKSLMLSR